SGAGPPSSSGPTARRRTFREARTGRCASMTLCRLTLSTRSVSCPPGLNPARATRGSSSARSPAEIRGNILRALSRGPDPWRRATLILALSIALWPGTARGHDPSAWGGLFRTRDGGATWLSGNSRSFGSCAIALAVSPVDPNHLLLATDSGVLASRNGGRDWTGGAPDVVVGGEFAVAYESLSA